MVNEVGEHVVRYSLGKTSDDPYHIDLAERRDWLQSVLHKIRAELMATIVLAEWSERRIAGA